MVDDFKDFGDGVEPKGTGPKIRLSGEDFECLPICSGPAAGDLIGALNAQGACAFIAGVLVESDERRFDRLIRSKRKIVEADKLVEIALWLAEWYAARPTPRPSGSPDGPKLAPVTSEEG